MQTRKTPPVAIPPKCHGYLRKRHLACIKSYNCQLKNRHSNSGRRSSLITIMEEFEDPFDSVELKRHIFRHQDRRYEITKVQTLLNMIKDPRTGEATFQNVRIMPDYGSCEYSLIKAFEKVLVTNDLLFDMITSYLPVQDLLNCRLVCRTWARKMVKILLKRTKRWLLLVKDDDDNCRTAEELLKVRANGSYITLFNLSLFRIDPDCPLYKRLVSTFGYTVYIVNLEDCKLTPRDLKQMLLVAAPNIGNLHYKQEDKLNKVKESTFKAIKLLCPDNELVLPKMKVLHWDEENGKTQLNELIEACPNLKSLNFTNVPLPNPKDFKGLELPDLDILSLSTTNSARVEHFNALNQLNLKLRKFTLLGVNLSDKASVKLLNKFVSSLADTLLILELWLDYSVAIDRFSTCYSPFPVFLPKLLKLQLEPQILTNINQLRQLPSLIEFEIISHSVRGESNWDAFTNRARIQRGSRLRSFRCDDIDGESLTNVLRVLPCITSLRLSGTKVDDSCLNGIIKNLIHLEELTIAPCFRTERLNLTDSGVTGISARLCEMFNENPWREINEPMTKTKPGLCDLQSLKKLDLSGQWSNLADASVCWGICNMRELRCLKMPVCQITDASLLVIRERLKNLNSLTIDGCSNVTRDAVAMFKNQTHIQLSAELKNSTGIN